MELVSGKVVQGCPNAGNPFHECTAICFEILNSGNVHKKEKKLFGFGKRTPSRDTPSSGSPARGSRSPLASYFAKKKVESDTSPSTDHTNGNFFSRLSPLQGRPSQLKNEPTNNMDSLPMSPSLAGYSGGDYFARRADQRGGEDNDDMYSPRPFGTQPKTPEHPLRTPRHKPHTPKHGSNTRPWAQQEDPISLETRPRTPERLSNTSDTRPMTPIHDSAATARRPQTPENRTRTAQHRGRSPEFMSRSPGPRSKTPEPQPTYFEPLSRTPKQRSKTPEPSPRIPQTHPISHRSLDSAALKTPRAAETRPRIHESGHEMSQTHSETGQISSQAYNYLGSKAESVYIEKDDESVLLYPELILSPQERPLSRPTTPSRRGYETPAKHEERFNQLDEPASSDDDKFSFVDDDQEDNSLWLYPELTPKSGSTTPVHKKSQRKKEVQDESRAIIIKENETREDVQSIMSESIVSVGDYKVRGSVSATLQQILDKHGDIASASKLHSLATRSYYLGMLASVVFELQMTPLKHLKESRVVEMLAIVRDVESVKIKAGWLKAVLEEIVEAVKHYDQHKMSMMEKEVCQGDVLLARQEMEKQGEELREKEDKLKEWRERTTEMASKVGSLDMRKARLDKRLAFLSSKVDKFQGESLLQDIL
ncbi:Phospholipase-like protein [Hirschfeldia incana]|nr:Phospholipase-like protein [Hirschfeldia incana]